MTTSSEGLSNVPIVEVPCLLKWNKILVSESVEIDGQKIQRLTIHYKFIGALETFE